MSALSERIKTVPIANCFVRGELSPSFDVEGLTALWSQESGVDAEQMTINLIPGTRQSGAAYPAMAFLYLPSLWSTEQVGQLQVGLARALSRAFAVPAAEVHVITSVVESGHVVESARTQEW